MKRFVLIGLFVSGCSGEGGLSDTVAVSDRSGSVVPVVAMSSEKLDAQTMSGKVMAQVISNGCTRADQFSVSHQISKNTCVLTVSRDAPDLCKRASFVSQIEIDWPMFEQCQSKEIDFTNPALTDD